MEKQGQTETGYKAHFEATDFRYIEVGRIPVLGHLLLIQFPANMPGKTEDGPGIWDFTIDASRNSSLLPPTFSPAQP